MAWPTPPCERAIMMNTNSEGRDRQQHRHAAGGARRVLRPKLRPLLPFRRIGGQHRDDVVDAARNAAVEIARLEARRDGVGDDDLGGRVGQRSLEPIADLDAHPVFVGRDEKQHAVVLLRFAEPPGAEKLVGVGLDLLAVERGDGRHDELDARLVLEVLQLPFERGARVGREDRPPDRRRGRSAPGSSAACAQGGADRQGERAPSSAARNRPRRAGARFACVAVRTSPLAGSAPRRSR